MIRAMGHWLGLAVLCGAPAMAGRRAARTPKKTASHAVLPSNAARNSQLQLLTIEFEVEDDGERKKAVNAVEFRPELL